MGTQAQEKILRTFRTSSMNKRLPQGDHQMDNSKKRKRSNGVSDSGLVPENIISARHLQGLLGDFSTQEALNNGLQQFRAFLGRCSKGNDVSDEDMGENLKILKEWLEAQSRGASDGDMGEGQGNAFTGILQVWSYASQNNSQSLLSNTMATLAVLVRICSYNEELKTTGAILCKSVLQPTYLKIIYRSLVINKEFINAPCLRLLTEINKFDFGSICGLLHSAFDFTTKNITKSLEVSREKSDATVATDDPHRPSLRTTSVRFVLSFFQFGSSSIKSEVLGQRAWISPIFKYLRNDSPLVVNDFLDVMSKKVLGDKEISRDAKKIVFNDRALSNIVALYRRTDVINTIGIGGNNERTVAEAAHEFLMKVCTTPGSGVCYSDSGWYPPGWTETDEKHRGGPRLHNRLLSSFILNIKPYADTLQQDLLLSIFTALPELVADYHFNNTAFDFDPKLTSTWIGYYAFISSTIQLPVPTNFGLGELSVVPPPTNILIENVMPKSLSKATLARCLAHPNPVIKFFVTRLLIFSFQKLQKVLSAIDDASAIMVDPSKWTKARFDLVEGFCKRVPDMGAVMGLINFTSKGSQGKLQKEAASRLLANYFELMPEVALAGKFDITTALGSFLADEDASCGEDRGLRLLDMSHLLKVAKDMPDVKWWNKSVSMPFSPFITILKVYCRPTSRLPLRQIRTLLHSFVAPSLLFQTETSASPLEVFLESLSSIQDKSTSDAIFSFLDESVARCIRTSFKYIDDYAELVFEISKAKQLPRRLPAVSPFTMTVVEQWKFFMQSKHTPSVKHAGSNWLARFLESSAILGENEYVLAALCERLVAICDESRHGTEKTIFKGLKRQLGGGRSLKLKKYDKDAIDIADSSSCQLKLPRDLFNGLGQINIDGVESLTKLVGEKEIEVSLFDIAIGQRAILGVLGSRKISCEDSCSALSKLMELLETVLVRLGEEPSGIWEEAKKMLVNNSELVKSFLDIPETEDDFPRYAYFSKRYSNLLSTTFHDHQPVLSSICERLKNSFVKMGHHLDNHPDNLHRSEILATYKIIIDQLFSPRDVLDCIGYMNLVRGDTNELQFDVLTQLLHRLSSRDEYLPINDLEKFLAIYDAPKVFCDALTEYIKSASKDKLEGFHPQSYDFNFHAELHEWKVALDSALIRKIESVRDLALVSLHKCLGRGREKPHLAKHLAALLEGFSVPTEVTGRFEWDKSMTASAKQKMENIFDVAQKNMFEGPMDIAQVELLLRAASLFSSLDKEGILKKVVSDNRSSSLTAKTVALLGTLIEDMSPTESEPTELRNWLLMAFDYLTRRFSEDETLSEKVMNFTKQLGQLLSVGKINLSSSVPRATLNAVLEAGLQKHINVSEVIFFAAVVVSQLPTKYLDLAKLLQMVLGHPRNPLLLRDSILGVQEIYHHTAYLIYRLFSLARSSQSNPTTLDGILGLYRGTNDAVDTIFLDIVQNIEAHLSRSLGTKITSWSVVDNAEGKKLISRTRGKFSLMIDGKTLARSVFQSSPTRPTVPRTELEDFGLFMALAKGEDQHFSNTYDLEFVLPALTYILLLEGKVVDTQAIIEKYCISFAITGLCSNREHVRKMAVAYIGSVAAKLEESAYREKTQIYQLLCSLLVSMETENGRGILEPLPTVVGVFFAQAVQVASNPGHFLYEKIMEFLLRRALQDLTDLPLMLQFSISVIGDEYQKEIGWILNVLTAGLRTEQDLDIYRKRNIFGNCLSLYISPHSTDRVKEKIIELLWSAAAIEGGSTTLITRNGIISFIEEQLSLSSLSQKNKTSFKRLAARLFESSAKKHVKEWSKGNLESQLARIYVK